MSWHFTISGRTRAELRARLHAMDVKYTSQNVPERVLAAVYALIDVLADREGGKPLVITCHGHAGEGDRNAVVSIADAPG